MRENRPYPKAIANAPELPLVDLFYWIAFGDLSTCRLYENGRIPWTAIKEYAQEHDLDEEQSEALTGVIRNVDDWFINFCRNRAEKEAPKGKHKGKGKHIGK